MKPALVGAAMAVGLLFMMHESLMSGGPAWTAAVGFVVAHVLAVGLLLSLALIFPKVRHAAATHRPSRVHVLSMVAGMGGAALAAHLFMHSGVV